MEAFNTGTLPSDKYVDTSKYEARMNAIRGGETVVTSERYDPNKDMESTSSSSLPLCVNLSLTLSLYRPPRCSPRRTSFKRADNRPRSSRGFAEGEIFCCFEA
jgi:hypothetical protein